jgi:hypothetical protein
MCMASRVAPWRASALVLRPAPLLLTLARRTDRVGCAAASLCDAVQEASGERAVLTQRFDRPSCARWLGAASGVRDAGLGGTALQVWARGGLI